MPSLTDKSDKLIIEALRKAAVVRDGMPPFATRSSPGLFPQSTIGRDAADHALRQGLFDALNERWMMTDAGLSLLLERAGPRDVLEDCVRALEARQQQLEHLQTDLRTISSWFSGLRTTIEDSLANITNNQVAIRSEPRRVATAILRTLNLRRSDAGEDCPLPQLFSQVEMTEANVTIGSFHDALRRLHQAGEVYLHPWTGPLYRVPEPRFALLIGHEVVYYASARSNDRPEYSTAESLLGSQP